MRPNASGERGETASVALEGTTLLCRGAWTAANADGVERALTQISCPPNTLTIDVSGIGAIDSCGAWLLHRTVARRDAAGQVAQFKGVSARISGLLDLVGKRASSVAVPPRPPPPGLIEHVGRRAWMHVAQYVGILGFVGELAAATARQARHPGRIRGRVIVSELESAGVNALPIVGLLTFLMGVVIAYQGGVVLRDYGASIYIADIVGLSTVRELSPLITAIIVAGRTGSAYTAQIGTMKVTDEIDALRSVGIAPLEFLVVPKVVALIVALPLLTVFGDGMGLLGGLVMSATMLDLNVVTYLDRMEEALTLSSYLSGVGKAPVFAVLIAVVGCFQGFGVSGSAASVGRRTTISVVQSIFLVLVVDAAFSVAFSKLDI